MTFERDRSRSHHDHDTQPDADIAPGRASRSAHLAPAPQPVISELVQRKEDGEIEDGAGESVAAAQASSGSPLPAAVQSKFESSLGTDLSGVRVHTGAASAAAADAVGAQAFTIGSNIHFGAGQYDPSGAGQHLLAHEVAHTVQQRGAQPVRQNKLAVSSPNGAAEHEADRAADAMVAGEDASVSSGVDGVMQLRAVSPAIPQAAYSAASTRSIAKKMGVGGGGNAVDAALHAVDWDGFLTYIQTANVASQQYNTNAPYMEQELAAIKQAQDHWKQSLDEAYEQEKHQIAQIINSDPEIRGHVKAIQSKSGQIKEALTKRNAELTNAEAAMDTLSGLKDAQKADAEQDKADKLEEQKKRFEDQKAAALKDVESKAALLKGAIDFANDVKSDGIQKAAAKLGTDLAKDAIVHAYSEWASGPINAEYNAKIRSVSTKIDAAKANVKSLKSTSLASQISGATKAFTAAMGNVEAHNATIGRLKKEVDGHRGELEQTMRTKHKNVALFNLTRSAQQAMAPLIDNYRKSLAAARSTLEPIKDWNKWLSALNGVKSAVSATDRVIGGDVEALPEMDFGDLEAHQRLPKDSAARKQREDTAKRLVTQYQNAIGPSVAWLQQFGQWLDGELAHVSADLEKCFGGEFTEFVREMEAKVHSLIDAKYL